jgi:5-methylcytosine-specific restriction endonuclease McrA
MQCKAPGCQKQTRNQGGQNHYCVMHLARLKRNGHLGLHTGPHKLEKLPHTADSLIIENKDKLDSEIVKILHDAGIHQAQPWNVKYRRRKMGIKKYLMTENGQRIKSKAKPIAIDAYGNKCELCDYHLTVDVHHIVPREQGGKNDLFNLIIVCPNCHGLITRRIITISSRSEIPILRNRISQMIGSKTSTNSTS